MSARASAYAKTLTVCPSGEMISPREKLVLIVLADAHQDKAHHFTYPAVETLAEDAMCDRRSCQRYLAALERKGVIRRMRPEHQGRGMQVFYFFAALDVIPEGWQPAALFDPPVLRKRAAEGRQKGGKRAANDAAHLMERAQEPELQLEQKQIQVPPQPPSLRDGGAKGQNENLPDENPKSDDVDTAVERVMVECGFTANRLRRKLRAVVLRRVELGEVASEVADRMIAAWKYQDESCDLLAKKERAAPFFEEGFWLDMRRLHWNPIALRDERQRAEARVGCR